MEVISSHRSLLPGSESIPSERWRTTMPQFMRHESALAASGLRRRTEFPEAPLNSNSYRS